MKGTLQPANVTFVFVLELHVSRK